MQLCPTQEKALERILALLPSSDVFVLWSRPGLGRSTVLRALEERIPRSAVLDASRWFLPLANEHPMRIEETFVRRALTRMKKVDALLIDDCSWRSCQHPVRSRS